MRRRREREQETSKASEERVEPAGIEIPGQYGIEWSGGGGAFLCVRQCLGPPLMVLEMIVRLIEGRDCLTANARVHARPSINSPEQCT